MKIITTADKIMDAIVQEKEWFAKSKERFEAYQDHDCHLTMAGEDGCTHPSHPQI